jgi:selenocysteine lyase/cysteine desulfurase
MTPGRGEGPPAPDPAARGPLGARSAPCPRREDFVPGDDRGFRGYFSDFGGRVYLDCAAQGPFPRETTEEVRRALRLKEHPEEIPETLCQELPDRARAAIARLLGCNPANIALGSGASHGINIAARGLPLKNGDEVLIPQGEFPANLFPWVGLREEGIDVRMVAPSKPGRIVTAQDLIDAIGPRTRAVSVSLVAFASGYKVDLQAIGDACRARDLFLVVDGAQGVGAVDFRVADHAIDILAVSGYKWLLGPYGTGFTYVNPRSLERLRLTAVNWQTVEGADQPARRSPYEMKFRDGARRFDIPETASFLNVSALAASVEFVNRVRVSTIEAHARRLLDVLLRGVGRTRLRVVSDLTAARRSTILGLEAPAIEDTRAIYRRVRQKGIVVSLRDNLIRVSPNIYNSAEDIDRFLMAAQG